jgi:hypothetical protein
MSAMTNGFPLMASSKHSLNIAIHWTSNVLRN